MTADAPQHSRGLFERARDARQRGQYDEAQALISELLNADPAYGPGWNMLGMLQLEQGDGNAAAASLERAIAVDPAAPIPWFNLANAHRLRQDLAAELSALDNVLARDEYFLPAILAKGKVLRLLGREAEAMELYRLLFAGLDSGTAMPPNLEQQLAEARALLETSGDRQWDRYAQELAAVAAGNPDRDLSRVETYARHRAGKRKIFVNQPTGGHFPFLPAFEFFPRPLLPWLDELERHTAEIREELLSLWADDDPNFRPYVDYAPGTALNQWRELNRSPNWSAWFLWENGRRNDERCRRCPRTSALLDRLPMLDLPGKGPTAMFSVLKPHTRIPPHTGTTNVRTTVHLPLVVPPGCGFRVGGEVREWREGVAWAFDDTIEHEAWNDSDQPRAILILDAWNPLLSEAERQAICRIG